MASPLVRVGRISPSMNVYLTSQWGAYTLCDEPDTFDQQKCSASFPLTWTALCCSGEVDAYHSVCSDMRFSLSQCNVASYDLLLVAMIVGMDSILRRSWI